MAAGYDSRLAERKAVGFSLSVEEVDYEGAILNGARLADQLIEPLAHVVIDGGMVTTR